MIVTLLVSHVSWYSVCFTFSVCYACCYFCLIGTCEAPINTSTKFFKSEGSLVMIFCKDGYFLDGSVTSTCVSNGSWVPDLLRIKCEPGMFIFIQQPTFPITARTGNHGSTSVKKGGELVIVGVSSAILLLFLFIVGVAVVFCCCRRKIGENTMWLITVYT